MHWCDYENKWVDKPQRKHHIHCKCGTPKFDPPKIEIPKFDPPRFKVCDDY